MEVEAQKGPMVKAEKDKPEDKFEKWIAWTVRLILAGASVFALYSNSFSVLQPIYIRAGHWLAMSMAIFLIYRGKGAKGISSSWFGIGMMLLSLAEGIFIIWDWNSYVERPGLYYGWEIFFGVITVLTVIEATRRSIGIFLPIVVIGFILYAMYGNYMPGFLQHRGYSYDRLFPDLYFRGTGLYGLAMYISASYLMMFVIFGSFLMKSKGDKWFIDMSFVTVGWLRGGPALTAILSSAIFGMMSGSPVANVVTTGTFTIPLMKRLGYRPFVAGAIEAVASSGGMFTPPIMGAGAFLIAEYLQVPYLEVIKTAIFPAALFYFSLMVTAITQAAKYNLKTVSRSELPSMRTTIFSYGHLIPPVAILIGMMLMGRSIMMAAMWSIIATVGLSMIRKATRLNFAAIFDALRDGAEKAIPVAAACASAGIIVGVISLTGLGLNISASLVTLAGGSPFLVLLYSGIAALILGMAMPPTAIYIILAVLTVPSLIKVGFAPMTAHFFVFFMSCLGPITPPVALAAYAGAGLAKANPHKVGLTACRFGLIGFILPFIFAYDQGILMQGSWNIIFYDLIRIMIAIVAMVMLFEGYFFRHIPMLLRLVLGAAAFLLYHPGYITSLLGFLLTVGVLGAMFLTKVEPAEEIALKAAK